VASTGPRSRERGSRPRALHHSALIDSVGSQANRIEPMFAEPDYASAAFLNDWSLPMKLETELKDPQ
jgi:hypothetical protein